MSVPASIGASCSAPSRYSCVMKMCIRDSSTIEALKQIPSMYRVRVIK